MKCLFIIAMSLVFIQLLPLNKFLSRNAISRKFFWHPKQRAPKELAIQDNKKGRIYTNRKLALRAAIPARKRICFRQALKLEKENSRMSKIGRIRTDLFAFC